jgi:hypothetical protein
VNSVTQKAKKQYNFYYIYKRNVIIQINLKNKKMAGLIGRSGRRPQEENVALIQKLTPLDDIAFEMLKKGIEENKFPYLKLYFQYKYGRPREMKEINVTSTQETPLFEIRYKTSAEMDAEYKELKK